MSTHRNTSGRAQRTRRQRGDAGMIKFGLRDQLALTWIGQQYAIRLDHLQRLLGQQPGRGARYSDWIGESAARDVVRRWHRAGWVRWKGLRAGEPPWIWPTRRGLQQVGLPYHYRDIERAGLDDLNHLLAINATCLQLMEEEEEGAWWISERQLLQGIVYEKGKERLHRPDAEIYRPDGSIVAVEVELSSKKPAELMENLIELLRGERYLYWKAKEDAQAARHVCVGERSQYERIWYIAPPTIRRQVWREWERLVKQEEVLASEVTFLDVLWYPLTRTDEEREQEEQEVHDAWERLGATW